MLKWILITEAWEITVASEARLQGVERRVKIGMRTGNAEGIPEMKPDWMTNPEQYLVRSLAGVWQQKMASNFGITVQLTSKEMGQLKSLKKALEDFTGDVIEWILNPVNWWSFCQQVRAESGLYHVPDLPQVGFLLKHYGRALRLMRCRLRDSTAEGDVSFCTRLDQKRYKEWKALLMVLSDAKPEWVAKIEKATTLIEIQQVFIDLPVTNVDQ